MLRPSAAGKYLLLLTVSLLGLGWVGMPALVAQAPPAAEEAIASPPVPRLPQEIPLDSPEINYIGRFTSDLTFGWSCTQVAFAFEGTSAEVEFVGVRKGETFLRIEVDGIPTQEVQVLKGPNTYRVADELREGPHVVRITRLNESIFGPTRFTGLRLDAAASLIPLPRQERVLLAVGDSITAGYGNSAPGKDSPFAPDTEKGDLVYTALAAQAFDAEYHCIAWSGRGMYRNREKNMDPGVETMPVLFDRVLPWDAKGPNADHQLIKPNVIVINLSTNDFARGVPPKEEFVQVYAEFVKKLLGLWPEAKVVCISGPLENSKTAQEYVQAAIEASGSPNVSYLHLTRDPNKEGLGAHWHPSLKTHELNGEVLAAHISKITGWKAAE